MPAVFLFPVLLLSFFDSCSLAGQSAQIEQFCTANNAAALYFDLVQTRGMQQECSFNAYAVGNTTNGEGFSDTGISSGNNNAFEYLDSFILSFDNLYMYTYGIAGAEFRDVISQLFVFQCFDNIHDLFLLTH